MTALIGPILTIVAQLLGLFIDVKNEQSAATKWYLDFVSRMVRGGWVNPSKLRNIYKDQDPKFPEETNPPA